jgi:hypothetical protein
VINVIDTLKKAKQTTYAVWHPKKHFEEGMQ